MLQFDFLDDCFLRPEDLQTPPRECRLVEEAMRFCAFENFNRAALLEVLQWNPVLTLVFPGTQEAPSFGGSDVVVCLTRT